MPCCCGKKERFNDAWFTDTMTKKQCHKAVLGAPSGSFLVRQKGALFYLAINTEGKLDEFPIKSNGRDKVLFFATEYDSFHAIVAQLRKKSKSGFQVAQPAPGGTELEEGIIPAEVFVPEKKPTQWYPEPVMLDDGLYVVTIACNGKSAGFTLSAAKDTEGNATVSGGVFVTTVKPKSPAFHCGALAGSQVVAVAGVDTRNASLKKVTSRVKACGDTIELTLEAKTETVNADEDGQTLNQKKTKRRKKGTAAVAGGGGGGSSEGKERLCATPDCGEKLGVGNWFHDGGEAVSVCRSCYTQAVASEQNRFFEVKDTVVFDELFGASVAAAAMGIVPATAAAAEAVEAHASASASSAAAPTSPHVLQFDTEEGQDDSDIDLDELDFGSPSNHNHTNNSSYSPPSILIRPRTSSVMSMDELDFGGDGSTTGTPPSSRRSPASPMIMVDETQDVGASAFASFASSSPTPMTDTATTATTTASASATVTNDNFALDVPVPASYLTSRRPSMDLPRAAVLSAALRVKSPGKRPPSRRRKAPPAALNLAAAVPVGGELREESERGDGDGDGEDRPMSPTLDDREARAKANLDKLKAKRNSKKSKSKGKSASSSKLQIGAPTDFVHLNVGGIQEASPSASEGIAARMASLNSSSNLRTPKAVRSPGGASLQSRMSSLKADSRFSSPASSSKCEVCGKTAYIAERLEADGKVYHKRCFKCSECSKTQSVGSYAALNGKIFCKPHFKQLFKSKGNYDEGFGTTQAKHKWDRKDGDGDTPSTTPQPTSKSKAKAKTKTVHHVDPESAKRSELKKLDGIGEAMSLSERTKRLNESHQNGGTPDGSPKTVRNVVKTPGSASLQSRMSSLRVQPGSAGAGGGKDVCGVCNKKAYLAERLEADGKTYHKKCFKCSECSKTQSVGSYAALNGKIFCKPHFKQLFKSKGNYDEGFGTTQAKHKWDHTPGGSSTAPSKAPTAQSPAPATPATPTPAAPPAMASLDDDGNDDSDDSEEIEC